MSDRDRAAEEFVAEATEILDGLGRDLLALDEKRGQEPDPDRLNAIFRGAHSLKGMAGMFGHERIGLLAHAAEDVLDQLRLGRIDPSDELFDTLIAALDVFGALVTEAANDEESPEITARARRTADDLRAFSAPKEVGAPDPLDDLALDPAIRQVFTEYEEHRLRENLRRGERIWRIRAAFDLSDFDQRLAALNAKVKPLGEVISTLPSSIPGDGSTIAFDLIYGSRRPLEELQAALEGLGGTLEELPRSETAGPEPVRTEVLPPPRALRPKGKKAKEKEKPGAALSIRFEGEPSLRSPTQTVRVDIRRLDELMNSVGELLAIKSNLQRIVEAARSPGSGAPNKLWSQELSRETRALDRRLDALQDGLLGARMVPLAQVFDKLARLVRRIAREAGKEIDLVVSGGEVELDKLIVEELSDPLMHTIRNAIDHGIEPPNVRSQKGKPRRGTVHLRAAQRGNHVVIEVTDDGSGMDDTRIREVAVSKGMLSRKEAREVTGRDLYNLIFTPGFSTAREVSELSGRGVGLDVVKTNIARLSGRIDVRSAAGKGTSFEITLPVTLAIIRALVVGVSGRSYAIPLSTVVEILALAPEDVRTVERREMLSVRGRTVPLVRLARLFRHPEPANGRGFAVVVGLAQERICLAVDLLGGQQDIVIKPLGGRLANVPGIAGATDLGDRKAVLILDVGAIIEEATRPERRVDSA